MTGEIVNKVAQSGILTLNLELYKPSVEVWGFDITQALFMGLIVKEKEFRTFLSEFDWSVCKGKFVAIYCSADAIVPTWAYMLICTHIQDLAFSYKFCSIEEAENQLFIEKLNEIDFSSFTDKNVVVKGCGEIPVPVAVYVEACHRLLPYAKKIMYGEPCSTVPVFRKK